MSQKILKQIRNEWRSNVWLALELLIVSVVLWYIVDFVGAQLSLSMRPLGFDVENCFNISLDADDETAAQYSEEDFTRMRYELLDRLSHHPDVEAACLSGEGYPYCPSSVNQGFYIDSLQTWTRVRRVSPAYARVFRLRGVNGETPEQLEQILAKGLPLVADDMLGNYADMSGYAGRHFGFDTLQNLTVGAVIEAMRNNDYSPSGKEHTTVRPLRPDEAGNNLSVRVKPGRAAGFRERILAVADKEFSIGPYFVSDVKSFSTIAADTMRSKKLEIRNYLVVLGFLLVNIFMGLLGTFWFRTQQRTKDIAMRKVTGATGGDVLRLLLAEGLVLLSIVTPVAVAIDANLAHLELNTVLDDKYFDWGRILLNAGVSYALMALMICLGIIIPARRAMRIAPAEALRDE